ncbi:MAG: hypothetical protein ACK5L6_10585 [Anaerorhabdus sp.]
MAKIKSLQAFEGELYGVYQKLWVAVSENNNFFKARELEYDNNGFPDFKNTKWKYISNEHFSQIQDEMYLTKKIDYKVRSKRKSHGLGY